MAPQLRGKTYTCIFCWHGKRLWRSLGMVLKAEAESAEFDALLLRFKQRLIELPPGVGNVAFVHHDGKPPCASAAVGGGTKALSLVVFKAHCLNGKKNGQTNSKSVARITRSNSVGPSIRLPRPVLKTNTPGLVVTGRRVQPWVGGPLVRAAHAQRSGPTPHCCPPRAYLNHKPSLSGRSARGTDPLTGQERPARVD